MGRRILLIITLFFIVGYFAVSSVLKFPQFPAFERQNQIYVVLSDQEGEIFNQAFMSALQDTTSKIFYLSGVDRSRLMSLTNINVVYRDVTEEGIEGGSIIPEGFSYGIDGYEQIKNNLLKTHYVGQLVSFDFKSAAIIVSFFNKSDGPRLVREIEQLLPQNKKIRSLLFGYPVVALEVKKQLAASLKAFCISFVLGVALYFLLIRKLKDSPRVIYLSRILLWIIFLLSLFGLLRLEIGHRGQGITILRSNLEYQDRQRWMSSHFAPTPNTFFLPAISLSESGGCISYAVMNNLDQMQWSLTNIAGARFVSSLAEAVKRLNMLFHENNFKWRLIPRDQEMLVLTTSQIDSRTGLLDDEGLVLPLNVFMENHDPWNLSNALNVIKGLKLYPDLLLVKIAGGLAAKEALLNEYLSGLIKYVLMLLPIIFFVLIRFHLPFEGALQVTFLYIVILSMVLGVIGLAALGLNVETISAMIVGSGLAFYLLGLRFSEPTDQKFSIRCIVIAVAIAGGLFSGLSLVFFVALISECFLFFTWVMSFMALGVSPGPRAKT